MFFKKVLVFLFFLVPIPHAYTKFISWIAWLGLLLLLSTWRCKITPIIVPGSISYLPTTFCPREKNYLDVAGNEPQPPA